MEREDRAEIVYSKNFIKCFGIIGDIQKRFPFDENE